MCQLGSYVGGSTEPAWERLARDGTREPVRVKVLLMHFSDVALFAVDGGDFSYFFAKFVDEWAIFRVFENFT